MGTFAQKPKGAQQTTSANSTKPGRAHFKQSREASSILHLQRTFGNQAVQRLLQPNAEELQAGSASTAPPRFGHDFSRIPVHSNNGQYAPSDETQTVPSGNGTESDTSGTWHTVKLGDSLSQIAADVYGDLTKWPLIFEANLDQISDPDLIEIGWRLFIPPLDTTASLTGRAIEGMDKAINNVDFAGECRLDRADWEAIDNENFKLKPGRSASAAVNRIFSGGTSMDCAGALWVSLAYSVLQTVGPDRFDRAMGKAGQDNQNLVIGKRVDEGMIFDLIRFPIVHSIDDLLPGDAVYFKNTEDIHRKHPGSDWQGENTIYRGDGQFSGLGFGRGTADDVLQVLAKEYNKPPTEAEQDSPDYEWRWRWDTVDASEIPGIQWNTVMRLDSDAVDLL